MSDGGAFNATHSDLTPDQQNLYHGKIDNTLQPESLQQGNKYTVKLKFPDRKNYDTHSLVYIKDIVMQNGRMAKVLQGEGGIDFRPRFLLHKDDSGENYVLTNRSTFGSNDEVTEFSLSDYKNSENLN